MKAGKTRMRWTYAEYTRLPTSGSTRYEVIDGELAVTPSPTSGHQQVVINLASLLHNFVREHALGGILPGPIDVLFGEGDYLQPDLVFVRTDRVHLVSERGIEGAPDLVVEILSPSTAQRDRGIKLDRYRHFGVAEYWIVDIDARSLEVWRLGMGGEAAEVVASDGELRWEPVPGGPVLRVSMEEVLMGTP
jgi:Uma2 family endonuclease